MAINQQNNQPRAIVISSLRWLTPRPPNSKLGSLTQTETQSEFLNQGFFTSSESVKTDLFSAQNCISQFTDRQPSYISLNGDFELSNRNYIGNKSGGFDTVHTWHSLNLLEENQGSRQSYFANARLEDSYYGDSSVYSARDNRNLSIMEYEHIAADGFVTRLENVGYSQERGKRHAGFTTEQFSVSGIYTGKLSGNYQLTIVTDSSFHVIYGDDLDTQDQHEPATGSFSLYYGNGDLLAVNVLPLPPENDYYLADFTSTRADGSSQMQTGVPFFKFTMD